jgi:hypothetical protein
MVSFTLLSHLFKLPYDTAAISVKRINKLANVNQGRFIFEPFLAHLSCINQIPGTCIFYRYLGSVDLAPASQLQTSVCGWLAKHIYDCQIIGVCGCNTGAGIYLVQAVYVTILRLRRLFSSSTTLNVFCFFIRISVGLISGE